MDILYLHFEQKIFKHFNKIFFIPNENIEYYEGSHKNYIYNEKINNLLYTFHGFYKDDYFIIAINSYDVLLDVTIEHREVVILKVEWILREIIINQEKKFVWNIDLANINKTHTNYFILPIRKKLLNSDILDIEDFKNVTKYNEKKVSFYIVDKKNYESIKKINEENLARIFFNFLKKKI